MTQRTYRVGEFVKLKKESRLGGKTLEIVGIEDVPLPSRDDVGHHQWLLLGTDHGGTIHLSAWWVESLA